MLPQTNLPLHVLENFKQANVLHKYVEEHLEKATEYAIEVGEKLIAAKKDIPHGRWAEECSNLFDGSQRTAQFYMRFSRDINVIPKAHRDALLTVTGTLHRAAKLARRMATQGDETEETIECIPINNEEYSEKDDIIISDPFDEISDPFEDETEAFILPEPYDEYEEPSKEQEKELFAVKGHLHNFSDTISRWLGKSPSLDEFRHTCPSKYGDNAVYLATELYEALKLWEKDIR